MYAHEAFKRAMFGAKNLLEQQDILQTIKSHCDCGEFEAVFYDVGSNELKRDITSALERFGYSWHDIRPDMYIALGDTDIADQITERSFVVSWDLSEETGYHSLTEKDIPF